MDWNNVNLDDAYEADQNIIEPLSFSTLLLEIHSNLKNINEDTVRAQFEEDLRSRIQCAREVFEANLQNIINKTRQK